MRAIKFLDDDDLSKASSKNYDTDYLSGPMHSPEHQAGYNRNLEAFFYVEDGQQQDDDIY